ncbi:MAG: hypothetical protein OXC53_05125 [Rhodobacteraceae bacterium]|nr:hypothetical protein [Paracoccaceae bacterium]
MRSFTPLIATLVLCAGDLPAAAQERLLFAPSRYDPVAPLAGAFSCPFDLLADLYAALAPREIPGLMAVESEVLLICAERQELLKRILEAERDLRELAGLPSPGPGSSRISITDATLVTALDLPRITECPGPADTPPPLRVNQGVPAAPAPAPTSPAADASGSEMAELMAMLLTGLAATARPAAAVDTSPATVNCGGNWRWEWTSRDPSGLRLARLRDLNGQQLEVREDDRLPTGEIVVGIDAGGVILKRGPERFSIPAAADITREPTPPPPAFGTRLPDPGDDPDTAPAAARTGDPAAPAGAPTPTATSPHPADAVPTRPALPADLRHRLNALNPHN